MAKLAINGGTPVAQLETPGLADAWGGGEAAAAEGAGEWGRGRGWRRWRRPSTTTWAAFNNSKHSLLVANGTVALQLAYEALDIGWGDEVLVPGSTWQATAAAVLDVNAVPVLVDIEPDTWCLDPKAAEAAITPRTRAIAVVHLYGCMANLDAIMDLASRHGLFVVEDRAHQHGGQWRGRARARWATSAPSASSRAR